LVAQRILNGAKTIPLAEEGNVFRGVTSEDAEEDKRSQKDAHPCAESGQTGKEFPRRNRASRRLRKAIRITDCLPSTCCAKAKRSQKLDEDELKQRAPRD